eukprot:358607-Chlamydomonas_euryale.AAC.3
MLVSGGCGCGRRSSRGRSIPHAAEAATMSLLAFITRVARSACSVRDSATGHEGRQCDAAAVAAGGMLRRRPQRPPRRLADCRQGTAAAWLNDECSWRQDKNSRAIGIRARELLWTVQRCNRNGTGSGRLSCRAASGLGEGGQTWAADGTTSQGRP